MQFHTLSAFTILSTLSLFTFTFSQNTCKEVLVRKEWRTLSRQEKITYTSAVVKLQNAKGKEGEVGVGFYAKVHQENGQRGIHWTPMFLPWHRYVTRHYELALRKLSPKVIQHYWDASLDHEDYWSAPIFGSSNADFGTMGKGRNGCVTDGPFKNFKPYDWTCLERSTNRTAFISPPSIVHSIITENNKFLDFALDFENDFHAHVHIAAGGIMLKSFLSPNEPLFFVHHSNVDRVWAIWQMQDPSRLTEYGGPRNDPKIDYLNSTLIGFKDAKVSDVMDIKKLCYTYDDLMLPNNSPRKLLQKSPQLLRRSEAEEITPVISAPKRPSYHLGEIVNLHYPTEIPDEWIKKHGADKRYIRNSEAKKRKIIDELNSLEGFVSPSCLVNRRRVLLKKIKENPSHKLTCTIRGKLVRIKVGRNPEETLENLMQVRERLLQGHKKPTVKQLASIIGKPCFASKTLYNPFEACEER